MISLIGNTIVGVLLYYSDRKPLQFHLIVNYLYMSCGASTKTIYGPLLFAFAMLWEKPKFATDTELIITDVVECAYPQTTRSSAALESSRPSESWMWLDTKDVALGTCSSYLELKELTQKFILSLIRQFMVSQKLIQCSKSKIKYLEIDKMWIWGYLWICSWLYQTSHMHCRPHWIYLY